MRQSESNFDEKGLVSGEASAGAYLRRKMVKGRVRRTAIDCAQLGDRERIFVRGRTRRCTHSLDVCGQFIANDWVPHSCSKNPGSHFATLGAPRRRHRVVPSQADRSADPALLGGRVTKPVTRRLHIPKLPPTSDAASHRIGASARTARKHSSVVSRRYITFGEPAARRRGPPPSLDARQSSD